MVALDHLLQQVELLLVQLLLQPLLKVPVAFMLHFGQSLMYTFHPLLAQH